MLARMKQALDIIVKVVLGLDILECFLLLIYIDYIYILFL